MNILIIFKLVGKYALSIGFKVKKKCKKFAKCKILPINSNGYPAAVTQLIMTAGYVTFLGFGGLPEWKAFPKGYCFPNGKVCAVPECEFAFDAPECPEYNQSPNARMNARMAFPECCPNGIK